MLAAPYSLVLLPRVTPRSLVVGVPARVRRELTAEEIVQLEQSWKNYVDYKDRYLAAS